MPSAPDNPAIQAFVTHFRCPFTIGEVEITESDQGYQLRHRQDTDAESERLTALDLPQLRQWVALDTHNQFRPLLSAPTLRRGWQHLAPEKLDLWEALNTIYPGSIGDWNAIHRNTSMPTSAREYVARQSGMYRGAAKLSPAELEQVTTACCADSHCLKKRLWSMDQEPAAGSTSAALVCVEACPLWLELARRFAKTHQEEFVTLKLPLSEAHSLIKVLNQNSQNSAPIERVADFSVPENPRRVDLLVERLKAQFPRQNDGNRE